MAKKNPVSRYVTVVATDLQPDNGPKPFVTVSLRIVEGPDAGVNLSRRFYLTEAALDYSLKQLRALGWNGKELSKAMQNGLGTLKAEATMEYVERNGKTYEDVGWINPIGQRTSKPSSGTPVGEADLAAFDALFADAAAAIPAIQRTAENAAPGELPAAKRATPKAAPVNNTDADMGF